MAEVLVVHVHHLHRAQAEAGQQILEALVVQQASFTVTVEQLLDVVLLLLLWGVQVGALRLGHVRRLGNLQVTVVVVVLAVAVVDLVAVAMVMVMVVAVVVVVSIVLVPLAVALGALVEEEGQHAQEAELGVQQDSHGPLASGALQQHNK